MMKSNLDFASEAPAPGRPMEAEAREMLKQAASIESVRPERGAMIVIHTILSEAQRSDAQD